MSSSSSSLKSTFALRKDHSPAPLMATLKEKELAHGTYVFWTDHICGPSSQNMM
jgi:hypothetical protein